MRYTYYIHNKWYDDSYEKTVDWVRQQYQEHGDSIVFADISPRPGENSFMASVIVKDLPESEPEPQTEQHKIQL